jgi:acyl-coenzyme A thioesterase 13
LVSIKTLLKLTVPRNSEANDQT